MGTARHIYREGALAEHRKLVAERTARFAGLERGARMRLAAGMDLGGARTAGPTPESVFTNCAACHSMDNDRAAPSIPELQRLYSGDVEGIVQWAREPGKKREQYAPMPSFAHLGEEKLTMAARYMLELGDEEPEGSGG
jgi:cytochrome c